MAIEQVRKVSPDVTRAASLRPAPRVETAALELRQEVRLGVVRETLEVAIIVNHFVRDVGSVCLLALPNGAKRACKSCLWLTH
jgi:hypothetical protein